MYLLPIQFYISKSTRLWDFKYGPR
ncbi:TPA: hypothetical protein ANIA_11429 [Aspergillus nidulans FGSC A4]|uniref:Uncharacterized protein n=1 Tax=Emericella nidulans (strain FGSC A4 / ATCC 38163 / CBS 112.46 / NRRL 194 / M139) TaxID=227321 RepID=C8V503_EMENI|nr:TPA: hypothetical protein ANIA_11429 [Aspergillus nidulans FGSC A4]